MHEKWFRSTLDRGEEPLLGTREPSLPTAPTPYVGTYKPPKLDCEAFIPSKRRLSGLDRQLASDSARTLYAANHGSTGIRSSQCLQAAGPGPAAQLLLGSPQVGGGTDTPCSSSAPVRLVLPHTDLLGGAATGSPRGRCVASVEAAPLLSALREPLLPREPLTLSRRSSLLQLHRTASSQALAPQTAPASQPAQATCASLMSGCAAAEAQTPRGVLLSRTASHLSGASSQLPSRTSTADLDSGPSLAGLPRFSSSPSRAFHSQQCNELSLVPAASQVYVPLAQGVLQHMTAPLGVSLQNAHDLWRGQLKWVLLWLVTSMLVCLHSAALVLALNTKLAVTLFSCAFSISGVLALYGSMVILWHHTAAAAFQQQTLHKCKAQLKQAEALGFLTAVISALGTVIHFFTLQLLQRLLAPGMPAQLCQPADPACAEKLNFLFLMTISTVVLYTVHSVVSAVMAYKAHSSRLLYKLVECTSSGLVQNLNN